MATQERHSFGTSSTSLSPTFSTTSRLMIPNAVNRRPLDGSLHLQLQEQSVDGTLDNSDGDDNEDDVDAERQERPRTSFIPMHAYTKALRSQQIANGIRRYCHADVSVPSKWFQRRHGLSPSRIERVSENASVRGWTNDANDNQHEDADCSDDGEDEERDRPTEGLQLPDTTMMQEEIRAMIAQTENLLTSRQSGQQSNDNNNVELIQYPLRCGDYDQGDDLDETEEEHIDSDDDQGDPNSRSVTASRMADELSDGEVSSAVTQEQTREIGTEISRNDEERDADELSNGEEVETTSEHEDDGLQNLEQQRELGELPSISNRDINGSKARALQNSMLGNLVRLGFHENLTRAALDAGVVEIDHYDSDCELAYVDIFMSLIKMVCDAHLDTMHSDTPEPSAVWMDELSQESRGSRTDGELSSTRAPVLPFKWPVFDMAQFEFGSARPGTCFGSVCVLTNLPKVSMDRTEELMEILSCNLFFMIGDPIQVVIPSASATGRTKGHAFLEFDDHEMAQRCALAVDGLTWGRGPFGRIRGSLFREYQVKSPTVRANIPNNETLSRSHGCLDDLRHHLSEQSNELDDHSGRNVPVQRSQSMQFFRGDSHELMDDCSDGTSSEGEEIDWVNSGRHAYSQILPPEVQNISLEESLEFTDDLVDADVLQQYPLDAHHLDRHHFVNGCEWSLRRDEEDEDSFSSASELADEGELDDPRQRLRQMREELMRRRNVQNLNNQTVHGMADTCHLPSNISYAESLQTSSILVPVVKCEADHQPFSESDKPWKSYCEELIARNREMQEQVAFARRRIVQLGHNNQKLHLLVDRVERDRDGLLFENDLLQTQLHGYEDYERRHEALMRELSVLRKRLKRKERKFGIMSSRQYGSAFLSSSSSGSADHDDLGIATSSTLDEIHSELQHHTSPTVLANTSMEDLKDWEQILENTLARVRMSKEEKALEMQKKLDRQVEEQQELKLCVICLANEKSILCLPCRHLCLCEPCSSRQEVEKCPICRLEIDEMLFVYA